MNQKKLETNKQRTAVLVMEPTATKTKMVQKDRREKRRKVKKFGADSEKAVGRGRRGGGGRGDEENNSNNNTNIIIIIEVEVDGGRKEGGIHGSSMRVRASEGESACSSSSISEITPSPSRRKIGSALPFKRVLALVRHFYCWVGWLLLLLGAGSWFPGCLAILPACLPPCGFPPPRPSSCAAFIVLPTPTHPVPSLHHALIPSASPTPSNSLTRALASFQLVSPGGVALVAGSMIRA